MDNNMDNNNYNKLLEWKLLFQILHSPKPAPKKPIDG
jgi:hypothetical protein